MNYLVIILLFEIISKYENLENSVVKLFNSGIIKKRMNLNNLRIFIMNLLYGDLDSNMELL